MNFLQHEKKKNYPQNVREKKKTQKTNKINIKNALNTYFYVKICIYTLVCVCVFFSFFFVQIIKNNI